MFNKNAYGATGGYTVTGALRGDYFSFIEKLP